MWLDNIVLTWLHSWQLYNVSWLFFGTSSPDHLEKEKFEQQRIWLQHD